MVTTTPQSGRKSSFSIALICTKSLWNPASASEKEGLEKDDLVPLWGLVGESARSCPPLGSSRNMERFRCWGFGKERSRVLQDVGYTHHCGTNCSERHWLCPAMVARAPRLILYKQGWNLKRWCNEVDNTAWSLLVMLKHSCRKTDSNQGCIVNLFFYNIVKRLLHSESTRLGSGIRCFYFTKGVYKVVLQKSIPVQMRQLIIDYY